MWACHCGYHWNPGRLTKCANDPADTSSEHYQVSSNTIDWTMSSDIRVELLIMTDQEELFAKFYNQEAILVKDMDISQLRSHRDELAKIAFEAKARLVKVDDETRERSAKSKNKEWIVPTDNNHVDSEALAAVKTRTTRMNKIEKLQSQLLAAGIDDETVKEMIRNVERKATEGSVKAITFNKPVVEQAVVVVDVKKPEETKEAFNPASLFSK